MLNRFEASYYYNRWFFCDVVICCRDIGNYKNTTISQQINKDLLETLENHEAKMESFYNLANNDDIIIENDIALSVNNDHSMINENVSQNDIYEDTLKSTKDKKI